MKGLEEEDEKEVAESQDEDEDENEEDSKNQRPGEGVQGEAAIPGRSLLLGLGNDILTDDGIGLRVASEVRQRLAADNNITVLASSEMGLALLDLVVGFDNLVIVDAVQTGKAAVGFVHEIEATELQCSAPWSPHFVGIGEMLALGAALGLSVPKRVRIFAVEVGDPFTIGTALTPELDRVVPRIVDQVLRFLQFLG